MKEHIIDISKQAIRTPSRFDLARIGAMMLFPDDESGRHRYEESAAFMSFDPQQLPEIVQWAMREMAAASWARFEQGILAGATLHEALGRPRLGLCESGKGDIVRGLISDLQSDPKKRFGQFSSKTVDNTFWPLFRPVAHFWAATFVAMKLEREPFPCALASFKDYLAMVEAYRIAGETTKAKQSPEPSILRPAETVKLPWTLQIRPADLEFLPVPTKKLLPIRREKTGPFLYGLLRR
jgi:hypothetical protein